MKIKHLLTKTLLVAVALLGGANSVWADDVASHDFNSSTTPFIIHDGARIGVTYEEHVADGGDYYAKYKCNNANGKAFAFYNFSSSVADAASVAVEFDCYFKSGSWQSFISLADANFHKADVLGTGNVNYGKTGAIFNLGQNRAKVSGTNENHFGINSAHVSTLDETCLEKWIHVSITVDNASRKVSYTIKNADQTSTLKSETNINFLDATAQRCSQVDIYLGNNTSNFVYIDNLVITKTVSDVSHNYTINAVAGGSTIKTNIKSGSATEGAAYTVSGLPYVVEKDGKFYVLDDANVINNGVTFTMLNADQTKTVNYTLDESIVYFKEAESFAGSSSSTAQSRASGGAYTAYFQSNKTNDVTTLNKGVYRVETYIWNRTDKEINLYKTSKDNANILASLTGSGSQSKNFLIDANSTAIKLSSVNNSCCFDYILIRKPYGEVDLSKIVGAVDFSTGANGANSSDYTMKPGDTKVFTFQNHGQDYGKNWRIAVKEGETWKANVSADSWDHTAGAATKVSYKVSKDGGSSQVSLDWGEFQADMADARVVATLAYGIDGTLAITTTSTGVANGYIYYVDQDVTGLTGDVTVNLSVNESWLEILSVEQTTVGATVGTAGYATYVNSDYDLDFSATSIEAYKVKVETKGVAKLTKVDNVPARTPVLLYKEGGATESIPVMTGAAAVTENDLVAGNSTTATEGVATTDGEYTNMILNNVSGIGFYLAAGQTVAANRAYLHFNSSLAPNASAPMMMVFDGETTGISEIKTMRNAGNEIFFDLQGRKVAQPAKGLYIVNGKKVVIK